MKTFSPQESPSLCLSHRSSLDYASLAIEKIILGSFAIFSSLIFCLKCPHLTLLVSSRPDCSRSPDEPAPVYGLEQPEEREPSEPSGKKLDKELKQGPVKTDIAEPLSQYELSSYPSESKFLIKVCLNHDRKKLNIEPFCSIF